MAVHVEHIAVHSVKTVSDDIDDIIDIGSVLIRLTTIGRRDPCVCLTDMVHKGCAAKDTAKVGHPAQEPHSNTRKGSAHSRGFGRATLATGHGADLCCEPEHHPSHAQEG